MLRIQHFNLDGNSILNMSLFSLLIEDKYSILGNIGINKQNNLLKLKKLSARILHHQSIKKKNIEQFKLKNVQIIKL